MYGLTYSSPPTDTYIRLRTIEPEINVSLLLNREDGEGGTHTRYPAKL